MPATDARSTGSAQDAGPAIDVVGDAGPALAGLGGPALMPVGGAGLLAWAPSSPIADENEARTDTGPATGVPAVVRFRPRGGESSVSRLADVSVRFTTAMDRTATQAAFGVFAAGVPVVGASRWAEGDTVLVFNPAGALPYGAKVELAVTSAARSVTGQVLPGPASVSFTVERAPLPGRTGNPSAAPSSGWRWPLLGPITQRFGETLTQYGVHQGIDIDGDTGDPVAAARDGRVTVAGRYDSCGGLEVHIDHGSGLSSWYRHLSRIDVVVGAQVRAADRIGLVGNTGCSLGSHLHFAIRSGSTFVDPLDYLPTR
jgi:murein DD-endopeptidase MepM/ murein hydrolase activator NlpD